ncbi:MAG: S41 family peptidase [Acidobacteriota bacterium]|nr:S41 family peptidase [Acidobacteriota bacterium]
MNDRIRFIILALTAPVLAYTLVGGLLGRVVAREDTYRHLRVFEDVVSLVTSNYVEPVEPDLIMRGALWGLAAGLDSQSAYLTADDVVLLDTPAQGSGIGLELTRQYYIQVVSARDGSPADSAGLRPGDYIREIDGQPTRMMSVVRGAVLLRGEAGSTVRLNVIRGNAAEPIDLDITRRDGRSANLTSRIVADGVGYVRLAEFDDTTAGAIETTVETLTAQGMVRLVLDLRGTATGTFDAGLAAAELFTDTETLVLRESSDGQQPIARSPRPALITLPVVILTNPGTAGAAELFTAALTDSDRADTVGLRTAGRAAEQTLVRLPDGSGLLLSSTRYLTASGEGIHRRGIEPTVAVQEPMVELGQSPEDPVEDPVLDRALDHLAEIPLI